LTLAAVTKRRLQRGSHVKAIEGATTMNTISTVLDLLKRQAELEEGLRQPDGNRVTEEGVIYALRERLQCYPQAATAILQAARSLNRPVEALRPQDIRGLA
jgi:hypothetical protein